MMIIGANDADEKNPLKPLEIPEPVVEVEIETVEDTDEDKPDPLALSFEEYHRLIMEIDQQPVWRSKADKEAEYADGNQLDSDLLRLQRENGVPPAIEDLISPTLHSIQGYEASSRTDWRVTANGDTGSEDVADAINFKLNQAERHSKADRACAKAFKSQIAVGIGWVEVTKETDPFKFPFRCNAIHRNEIHCDMKAIEDDLSDARWLRRQKWMSKERAAAAFPEHKELIMSGGLATDAFGYHSFSSTDGGASTGLQNAHADGRAWTMQEEHWFNIMSLEVCISEIWYRRYVDATVIRFSDGRAEEFDINNARHVEAVISGQAKPRQAVISRVRRCFWLGPRQLSDEPSPYPHNHFPYVPFWGYREDMTNIPYGFVRGMLYQQDALNSGISKLRWGLSVVRTERTKGAVEMTDAQLRRQIARNDSDIVLNAEHMAKPGSRFEVIRDYQLNDQQHQMIQDNRAAIERVSGVTSSFMGKKGNATSGLQESTQVEQSNQGLAWMMDNFRTARSMVGELLMALIIEEMGEDETTIIIEGDAVREDRTVVLNKPDVDPMTGRVYLSNDIQRTRLKVALEDVPSSNSYRSQQLGAMSEALKSMPAEYQKAVLPFMVSLMDVPFKRDVVGAIRAVDQQQSPDQIQEQIKQAVEQERLRGMIELKTKELDIKGKLADSEVKKIDATAVQIGVQAAFAAMQAGAQIVQQPGVAPIADVVMQGAGYQVPNPIGVDPNFPQPQAQEQPVQQRQNTSPQFPAKPINPGGGGAGIETSTPADNI